MFQIFRTRFGFFAGIGVTGSLLMLMPAHVLQRSGYEEGPVWLLLLLSDILLTLIVTAVMHAVFVMGAYDVRARRPVDWRDYLRAALQLILPLVSMMSVSALLLAVGFVLLVLPGIWLIGLLSVVVPAVVVDRAGFDAIKRSRSLTKGFRWPIVGLIAILSIVSIVGAFVVLAVEDMSSSPMPFVVVRAVVEGPIAALAGIAAAVTHMRLREIKEGFALAV